MRPDRPIRVLVNALHSKSGGGLTYLHNLLPILARDPSLDIHILVHKDQMEFFGDHDDRLRKHFVDFGRGIVRLLAWEQVGVPMAAATMDADVIFSPANFGPFLVRNQVITLHNSLRVMRAEHRLRRKLYWVALSLATAVSLVVSRHAIAVSDYAARTIRAVVPWMGRRKLTVVHHGVGPLFSPDPEVPREDFLLVVADIYVQKNLHTLIAAMPRILKAYPGTRLKIVGRRLDSDYWDELHAQMRRLGVEDAVDFLGGRNPTEVRDFYRRCKVFVFPSSEEAFGMPIIESMACACAIASSNTAAMPEVAGEAALFFDPHDAGSMAEAVTRLLRDDALRADLSARARARAAQFTWEAAAAKVAEVLKAAAGTR